MNIEKDNISLSQQSSFTKRELRIISFLIKNQIQSNNRTLRIDYDALNRVDNNSFNENVLSKIAKKNCTMTISIQNEILSTYTFSIFSYLFDVKKNEFEIYLNTIFFDKDILFQLKSRDLFYEMFSLLEKESKDIYLYFINKKMTEFYITVKELKEIYSSAEKYVRFFDFEKFCLKPTFSDINSNTSINIYYTKVKHGKNIVGLDIELISLEKNQDIVTEIYKKYSLPIAQYNPIKNVITNLGKEYSTNTIMKSLDILMNRYSPKLSFEEIILDYLTNSSINLLLSPTVEIQTKYENNLSLLHLISKHLDSLGMPINDQNFYSSSFLKEMYTNVKKNFFFFENKFVLFDINIGADHSVLIKIYAK
jgi:hypothetical protein